MSDNIPFAAIVMNYAKGYFDTQDYFNDEEKITCWTVKKKKINKNFHLLQDGLKKNKFISLFDRDEINCTGPYCYIGDGIIYDIVDDQTYYYIYIHSLNKKILIKGNKSKNKIHPYVQGCLDFIQYKNPTSQSPGIYFRS